MLTFLTVVALIGLVVFVVGAIMWFASVNDTTPSTPGIVRPADRVRNAIRIERAGLVLWAIATIILGIIGLVDLWT